ncbi:MAG: monofunctional biosynthetic peptidoglycan transglycosylase [Elusimicrobia bacterium]|nr:MAG: monofunctional biosynthetic peptidoglycan transglycosylase [Elusimicrobiota bacterium]
MARRPKRPAPRRPRGPRWVLRAALTALGACLLYLGWLPDPTPLKSKAPKTTAYIELRRAQAADSGKKFNLAWTYVPSERIAQSLKDAVVMSEDGSFWRHRGIDWESVDEAVRVNFAKGRFAYGGSTITQQLARNLYLSPSKNPLRKLKEALIARRLERTLGKRRILELYLNIAEWGPGVFGCEAASRRYFGKSAADLTYEEAAALASVLPSPRKWHPVNRSKRVERRVQRLLARLKAVGKFTPAPLETPEESLEDDGSVERTEDAVVN